MDYGLSLMAELTHKPVADEIDWINCAESLKIVAEISVEECSLK